MKSGQPVTSRGLPGSVFMGGQMDADLLQTLRLVWNWRVVLAIGLISRADNGSLLVVQQWDVKRVCHMSLIKLKRGSGVDHWTRFCLFQEIVHLQWSWHDNHC
jgi:hypothetical protein